MKLLRTSFMTAVLLGAGLSAADAAQQPNYYECVGRGASLSLSVGSKSEVGILPATTALNLELGKKSYSYQDTDISVESTLIGDLWEVTLGFIPDVSVDHASLVIPQINLGNAPYRFASKLILTHVQTPITTEPPVGVVNASKYIDLNCTASVLFY